MTKEDLLQLAKLPSGNVGDANGKRGVMDTAIKPVDPKSVLVGPAFTCGCYPGDNLAIHQAIYAASPGDVLVCDLHGYAKAGHFGDIMAAACTARGIAGLVMNGTCRDSEDIKKMGFPVFSLGYNPTGTVKEGLAQMGIPIVVGGVLVRAGDIIMGDCDGVVVLPKENAGEVLKKAQAIFDKEIEIIKMLEAGRSTLEIYGFDKLLEGKLLKA